MIDDPLSVVFGIETSAPVLVHSDLRYLLGFLNRDIREILSSESATQEILKESLSLLQRIVGNRDLWLPAYNYDFCRTGLFDVDKDPSQVGSLPEYFRDSIAQWRTAIPVFSHCGIGEKPSELRASIIDPFGEGSDFLRLRELNGYMLFFGVKFSPTYTHHVERCHLGGPLYRYDKYFAGEVKQAGQSFKTSIRYHVIPRGLKVVYDMEGLFNELIEEDLMKKMPEEFGKCYAVRVNDLHELWSKKMAVDPYSLLDASCRRQVETLVSEKGRRFMLEDFE